MARVAIGGFLHETNCFVNSRTIGASVSSTLSGVTFAFQPDSLS